MIFKIRIYKIIAFCMVNVYFLLNKTQILPFVITEFRKE